MFSEALDAGDDGGPIKLLQIQLHLGKFAIATNNWSFLNMIRGEKKEFSRRAFLGVSQLLAGDLKLGHGADLMFFKK